MKEYIKINLASPQRILNWTERPLPNGELIGEITKPLGFKKISEIIKNQYEIKIKVLFKI